MNDSQILIVEKLQAEIEKLRLERAEYVNQLTECYFAIGALKANIDKLNETLQSYLKTIGG